MQAHLFCAVADRGPVARGRDGELRWRAQHHVVGQVKPVLARAEIRDGDRPAACGHHETVRPRAAGHRGGAGPGHEDVVARPAGQDGAAALCHQKILPRAPGKMAAAPQDGTAARVGQAQRSNPGSAVGQRKDLQPGTGLPHGQPRDPAQPAARPVFQRVQMHQPPVGQQGQQAEPVIAATRDDKDLPVHRHCGDVLHRAKAGGAGVEDVIAQPHAAGARDLCHAQRSAACARKQHEFCPMGRNRGQRRRPVRGKPLRRPDAVGAAIRAMSQQRAISGCQHHRPVGGKGQRIGTLHRGQRRAIGPGQIRGLQPRQGQPARAIRGQRRGHSRAGRQDRHRADPAMGVHRGLQHTARRRPKDQRRPVLGHGNPVGGQGRKRGIEEPAAGQNRQPVRADAIGADPATRTGDGVNHGRPARRGRDQRQSAQAGIQTVQPRKGNRIEPQTHHPPPCRGDTRHRLTCDRRGKGGAKSTGL